MFDSPRSSPPLSPAPSDTGVPPAVKAASHPILSDLKAAIEDSNPYCTGTYQAPLNQCILFYGKDEQATRLNVATATQEQLDRLMYSCDAATFGKGKVDVLDETYRKAGKIDLGHFASTFSLPESGMIEAIRNGLLTVSQEKHLVHAELYKLNVYGKGAFFKSHKDTPRATTMFGSLVVVLPSRHEGGTLLIRHRGGEWSIESGSPTTDTSRASIAYAAFYNDVEHEVAPVTSGHRVTLTYNLHFVDIPSPTADGLLSVSASPNELLFQEALEKMLADETFMPEGGTLGFGLSHQYSLSVRDRLQPVLGRLKGTDEVVRKVCDKFGLEVFLRAVYETNEGNIMTDDICYMPEDQYDDSIADWLEENANAVYLTKGEYSEKEDIDIFPVEWVTELTAVNGSSQEYIAYGNQAELCGVYYDLCMIVSVGDIHSRKPSMSE